MKDTRPRPLSVVIVSYGSQRDLARLLPTLYREAPSDLEVIVVDNCPGDGSAAWLEASYPDVRVLSLSANLGYAGGNNIGIAEARGQYVLILNPDTALHAGTLGALLEAAQANPDALITAKLLRPDGRLNACGLELHYTGVVSCRGLGQKAETYTALHTVPLVSGAALIASRELLTRLGGFAETYFMYFEDVDLSLRARLLGYQLLCAGDAPITHHYRLGLSATKVYLLERNRLLTLFRLYSTPTLRRLAPSLILTEGLMWLFALVKGPAYISSKVRGYRWLWQQRRVWQAERRKLQTGRMVSDERLLEAACTELPVEQLIPNAALARTLRGLTRHVYAAPPLAPRRVG